MAYGKRAAGSSSSKEEVHIDIGKSKQVSIRQFNGINLVDIREYYTDKASGELRPGKKGISLTEESWNLLVENQATIQKALNKLKGVVESEEEEETPKSKKQKTKQEDEDEEASEEE